MPSNANSSVWFRLWYRPRLATRQLLETGRGHSAALVIAALFGLVQSHRVYISGDYGPSVFLFGALFGVGGLYFVSWLLRNFGRWFGSHAAQSHLRTALGTCLLPWTILFLLLALFVGTASGASPVTGLYSVFFCGFVYGYIIILLGLSAALKISVLKTFLCLVVTCLVTLFPFTMLAQIFFGAPGAGP